MTSTVLPKPAARSSRRRIEGYPADSLRFDLIIALLSSIFLAGLFLDGWAHNNIPDLIETFFTPYHALLYGGYALVAAVLTGTHLRNIVRGHGWSTALPRGYFLALGGVALFTVGGVGDLIWHETFGFEEDTEALLSPTHLLLAAGALLYCTAPMRSAWQRATTPNQQMSWRELTPALISMLILLSVLTFFTQYASPAWAEVFVDAPTMELDTFFYDSAALFRTLMPSILVMGSILYLMRRWRLPFGSMTFLIGINYTLMFLMAWDDSIPTAITLPAILLSGLIADWLYMRLQPSAQRLNSLRWFAFLVPFAMIGLFIISLLLTKGLWWKVHMWGGVPFVAGICGLFLSYIAFPAEVAEASAPAVSGSVVGDTLLNEGA